MINILKNTDALKAGFIGKWEKLKKFGNFGQGEGKINIVSHDGKIYRATKETISNENTPNSSTDWELVNKEIEGNPAWLSKNSDNESDPQKSALWKGNDLFEAMEATRFLIIDAGRDYNIDEIMANKPETYAIMIMPRDTTTIHFAGRKWIEDKNYNDGELVLPKQQALIVYGGTNWKARFINHHSVSTKNILMDTEFYEGSFTNQFINISTDRDDAKIRFFLGTNGTTILHNRGLKDISVFGYISTATKEADGDIYTLRSGSTAIFNHLFGDRSFVVINSQNLEISNAFNEVGNENDLGLNRNDDTLDKILLKLNDWKPEHEITGQFVGVADTFAKLATLKIKEIDKTGKMVEETPSSGDYAILNQDEIGTGDIDNPQYPRGYYVTDGTGIYSLKAKMATGEELTVSEMKDLTSKKNGLVDGEKLNQVFPKRDEATFTGTLDTDKEDVQYIKKLNQLVKKTPNQMHNITVGSIEPIPSTNGIIEGEYQLKNDLTDVQQWLGGAWVVPFDKTLYVQGMIIDVDNPKVQYSWDKTTLKFIKQANPDGRWGEPVENITKLKELTPKDDEFRHDLNGKRDYRFKSTARLSQSEIDDNNNITPASPNDGLGKWIYQIEKNIQKLATLETMMGNSRMENHPDYMSMHIGTPIRNDGGFTQEIKDGHAAIVFPRDGIFEITNSMTALTSDTIEGEGYKNQRFGLYLYREGTEVREIDTVEIRMDDNGQTAYPRLHGIVDAKAGDYLKTLTGGSNGYKIEYINRKITIQQQVEASVLANANLVPVNELHRALIKTNTEASNSWVTSTKGTPTKFILDVVVNDKNGLANGNNEIVIKQDGEYRLTAEAVNDTSSHSSDHWIIYIYKNGVELYSKTHRSSTDSTIIPTLRFDAVLVAGDILDIRIADKYDTHRKFAGEFSVEQLSTHTIEKIDPALVPIQAVLEDEIKHIDVKKDDGETIVSFAAQPSHLILSGGGFSEYSGTDWISFKDLKESGVLKRVITGKNDISDNPSDSSEIFHIVFEVRFVTDVSVGITVIRSGYTEKADDFAVRTGYSIKKIIATYKTTSNIVSAIPDMSGYMKIADYDKIKEDGSSGSDGIVDQVNQVDGGTF